MTLHRAISQVSYTMQGLAEYTIYWIEEPTSPDDILGHRAISQVLEPLGIKVASGELLKVCLLIPVSPLLQVLEPLGIKVASGEVCCNKVMFKQFLASEAIQVAQIDSCRLGSINEILPVYLMAYKLKGNAPLNTLLYNLARVPNGLQVESPRLSSCWRCWFIRDGATPTSV
uniref:Mitochondrial enolase superfamily member 1 n=1 Tax=Cacopsylla melanoneura TaxID=428564 RepID=A0A8D9ENJ1_9HEMI